MVRNDLEDLLCQKGYHRLQRICFYCFVFFFSPNQVSPQNKGWCGDVNTC